jgi:DNA-binding NtrC family response regulator
MESIDLVSLVERALDAAVAATGTERGYILASPRETDVDWNVLAARNFGRRGLPVAHILYSRTLAASVLPEKEIQLITHPFRLPSKSSTLLNVAYLVAAPLPRSLGVLVLDSKKPLSDAGFPGKAALEPLVSIIDELIFVARQHSVLERRLDAALTSPERPYPRLVGSSPAMRKLWKRIEQVAFAERPVLILGETGTGKGELAETIYDVASRRGSCKGRFVRMNVTELTDTLAESELFGHKKGSFTGALGDRTGLIAAAEDGMCFLDEIGDLAPTIQSKLLRVLESGKIRPVGADHETRTKVRFIAATHRDLEALVAEGKFRKDLFFRLNVLAITMPALRERREDIPELVDHFLGLFAAADGKPKHRLAPAALEACLTYSWPGNVRELEAVLASAVTFGDSDTIEPSDLGILFKPPEGRDLRKQIKKVTRQEIAAALERSGGDPAKAAKDLGRSRAYIYKQAKLLGISLGRRRPRS